MSFMNSGAECSTSRNPLAQFTKFSSEDRSLQHERFTGPGLNGPMSMRSNVQPMTAEDIKLLQQFNNNEQKQGNPTFAFDSMRSELNGIQGRPGPQVAGLPQTNWTADFRASPGIEGPASIRHSPAPAEAAKWGSEFNHMNNGESQSRQVPVAAHYAPQMSGLFGGLMGIGQMSGMQTGNLQMSNTLNKEASSSSRMVELDNENWEEQFRQIEEESKEKGKEKETQLDDDEESQAQDFHGNFENIWKNIQSQVLDNLEDWTSTVNEGPAWDRDFDEYATSRPEFGDYQFEENNSFMDHPDPFTIGVHLMESGGRLSDAALAFEAAVQKNPEHVEAWSRLGAVQAQNEKEDPAIRALERCIKLDPTNLIALMNLSVSYTNEGYENAAYATLEKWLATKYPDVVEQARVQEPALGNEDRFQLHNRVTELFIRAAQLSPDGANMDADVQVGLGVLFYGNDEYAKAVDCFNAAITVRPDDPLLWNRLGATLANSHKSEDAIEAYYKALELRPSFVRARYNLGVSCINIGCYHEAAQHLLGALAMHKVEGVEDDVLANQSTNLYETLKRVFLAMHRRDLVERVTNGMDVNTFRDEFEF